MLDVYLKKIAKEEHLGKNVTFWGHVFSMFRSFLSRNSEAMFPCPIKLHLWIKMNSMINSAMQVLQWLIQKNNLEWENKRIKEVIRNSWHNSSNIVSKTKQLQKHSWLSEFQISINMMWANITKNFRVLQCASSPVPDYTVISRK